MLMLLQILDYLSNRHRKHKNYSPNPMGMDNNDSNPYET